MKQKLHYSWVICILGLILIFITMGTVNNGFSIYLPYLRSINGFTNTQTSFLVDLRCLVSFLSMLVIGLYYKKLSLRAGCGLAAFAVLIAFGIYTFAGSNYMLFCLGSLISGLGYGFGSMIPVSILMKNWFHNSLSLAIGISAAGSGIATMILPPLITTMIEQHSLRFAFFVQACIVLILTVILLMFLRDGPAQKGLLPYGLSETDPAEDEKSGDMVSANNNISSSLRAIETKTKEAHWKKVWIYIAIASFVMGILANPVFSHLTMLFTSEGFPAATAAMFVSIFGVVLTISKLVLGRVTDRIGIRRSFPFFSFIMFAGIVLLCLTSTGNMLVAILGTILLGIGLSVATIAIPAWTSDLTTSEQYPRVVRRLQILYALAALIFTGIPGILADLTGGYIISYALFSVLVLVAILMSWLTYRKAPSGPQA